MADLAKKFGVPSSLLDYIKRIQVEETEYQSKVKALMAKKGIKSLGDLSPDEKKKFFSQLDAIHQAKNEEVEPIQEAPKKPVVNDDDDEDDKPTNSIKTFLVKFEKDGNAKIRNYTGKDESEVRSRAKVDAQRMGMSLSSVRLREEYEQEILAQDIDESFSDAQIAKLKSEYSKINTIDPSSPNYKKLTAMLDKLDKPALEKLAGAGIKFISGLAKNRVNRMKNEEVEIDESGDMGAVNKGKEKTVMMRHKTSGREIVVVPSGVKEKQKLGFVVVKEEVEIDEAKSDYEIYHKDFSTAVQHAWKQAEKRGYEIDKDDWDRKVAMGPRKPGEGKTNSYSIALTKAGKPQKKALQIQVYNKGGRNPYELNMYVEDVQIEEAQEFKQGGKPLAKKFEKAFAKMGIRAKVKMHTVGNVSVNEKKDDKEKEENGKKNNVKSGQPLSGKQEPIEINPEFNDK